MRFRIDDEVIDATALGFTTVDDLDMEEWEIMYEYAGLTTTDFAIVEDEAADKERERRVGQPAFTRTLLHILYRRAHPEATADQIREITGRQKIQTIYVPDEGDVDPPALTTAPESPDASSESGSESESSDSNASSDEPESQPAPTGTPG